ncbi:MAG: flagellar hook-associated protein FlgL [Pyrinomonadaceae bacterium]
MNFRVSDSTTSSNLSSRINSQRSRLGMLQEQLTSGKRINRASDDPSGMEMVLNLRTSQTEIAQFQRSNQAANQKLVAADDALNTYGNTLDRVRTLITQGLSDTSTQVAKNALATELESLRGRILATANTANNGEYLFGGIRQNEAPFDPTTAVASPNPTSAQYIQIEPGSTAIAVGVTADTVFSDATSTIFTDLTNAIAALRGTGDPVADRATLEATSARMTVYNDQANTARAIIGANMNATDIAADTLKSNFLSLDMRASDIESVDFAEAALGVADAERSLEATLQLAGRGRRSLFDYLG